MKIINEFDYNLKDCPCCGSSTIKIIKKSAVDRMEVGGKGSRFCVKCNDCGIQTDDGHSTEENAIKTWNKRTDQGD